MKISIITITLNSAQTITDCIASVNNQTYKDIEHIIVDGGSEDNTVKLIRSLPNRVKNLVSEPDKGIYDAMNKGILRAAGDIIGILNSDDFYASDHILEHVACAFAETGCDSLYGNLNYVSAINTQKVIRYWKSSRFVPGSFAKGWHPPHPTFFVRREIYQKYGFFDTSLQVSADFELMLRLLEKIKISSFYLDEVIVNMRMGGESSGSLANILKGNKNVLKAFKKNKIPVSPFYLFLRFAPKIREFFSHPPTD
ncbi:MAG: glycosyltransferase [Bacteroidales bacterium]|nr:glycosyltransferase [Bacteroidales bacterium]